ncbi:hypothetical protein ACAG25_18870 [Mycobacterium sp. pV006]|uniref:hypothetical protein n=1 Tax=Mycobacterium sp. pV006 TaxID=3238983 RepID=UPI00351B4A7D
MGALAMALGIGFAVVNSTGVAYAETDGDSSVSASRDDDRSSSPRRAGADRAAPSRSGSTDTDRDAQETDPAGETADELELDDVEVDEGPPADETEPPLTEAEPAASPTGAAPTTGAERRASARQAQQTSTPDETAAATEQTRDDADIDAPVDATLQTDQTGIDEADEADDAVDAVEERTATVDLTVGTPDATPADETTVPVEPAESTEQNVETVGVMTTLVSNLVSPFADPSAPARAPWFDALLAWVRRQITHTFFNRTPVWGPVESQQLLTGQVEFDLNAWDPNDDPLTYKISQPEHGLVTRNPLTDKFVYTPLVPVTGQPLQDKFYVTISDSSEHLKGIGGMIQGIFHSLARMIGLAQPDEVTLAVSVTANPIVEIPPVVVVTPVATGLVGTEVKISPVVVVTDLDSDKLVSATVTIRDPEPGDVLDWGELPEGVTVSVGDGTVTFTGPATVTAYQQLLQTVTLRSDDIGIKTVTFAVVDDQGKANLAPAATVVTIVGLPVEVPPLVLVAPVAAGRTDSPIQVSPIVVITDIDSDILASATVRITDPAEGDTLSWGALPEGVSVDSGHGWVTFTGDFSADVYQQLLQSVRLTSDAPSLKSVSFSVVDGDGNPSVVRALTAVTVLGLPVDVPPLIVVSPVAVGAAGTPIKLSPVVMITDLDSERLRSATVTLGEPEAGDLLDFTATLPTGVKATYAGGVLTFTGEASIAAYRAILESVTLTSAGAGLKAVSFAVTDIEGNKSVAPAGTVVTVLGVPDVVTAPVVVVTPVAAGVVGARIKVTPIVAITDLDSPRLRSATVTLDDPDDGDVLGFTAALPTGVGADFADGVLTFSGVASVEQYRALLASVTLTSTTAGIKAISFAVTDEEGHPSSLPAGTLVTVVGVSAELPPLVLVSPVAAGRAGSPITVSPILLLTDVDSEQLQTATVKITDPADGDVLSYTGDLPTGVRVGYSAGALTFDGPASLADYQRMLAAVTLSTADAGVKTVTFSVTDVEGNTSKVPAVTLVTVIGLPDVSMPPVIVATPLAAGTVDKPIRVSPVVVITDLDSDYIGSATITLGDAEEGDRLAVGIALPTGVDADYTDGILTLTGKATVDQYRQLLQSVTLTSASAGIRTVSFSVTDLEGAPSLLEAATLVTVVELTADVPPLVVVAPVAAGLTDSPIVVSPIVVLTDPDSTRLKSATVTVLDARDSDVLGFTASLPTGVDVSYAAGSITFSGGATVAAYRELLQSVTLTSTTGAVKAVSFSVTDDEDNVSVIPAATLVTVVGLPGGLSIAPVVVVSPVAAGTTGEPIQVSPIMLITDLDSDRIRSATVTLADPGTGDELTVTADLPEGVQANYAGGVLTIVGTATVEQYEDILRSVTLTTDTPGVRAVGFEVIDSDGAESLVAGTLVTIVGLQTEVPPLVLVAPAAVGLARSAIRLSPIVVVTDPDSDLLKSAVIRISDPGDDDVLAVTGPLPTGATAVYNQGTLTISWDATTAQYQDILSRVTLTTPNGGIKHVSFTLTDAEGQPSVVPAGTIVTVVGLLDLAVDPVVVVSPLAAGTVGDAIRVSPVVVITDLSLALMESATVSIENADAGDRLEYTAPLPQRVNAEFSDGVLTFTGPATADEYAALLASVTLTSETAGLKTLKFAVTNALGLDNALAATTAVTVLGLPDIEFRPLVVVSPVAAGVVDKPIRVSPLVVIEDLDSTHLRSAKVTLVGADADDVLAVTAALPTGFTAGYAGGVLTINGEATLEVYQTLLSSVMLTSATASIKTVTFEVTDIGGATSAIPVPTLVTVVGVPQVALAPVVVVSPLAAGLAGSDITVSPLLLITDLDASQIRSATVRIEGGAPGDVLGFDDALIDGLYADGLLTFSSTASVADYQTVLRSVTLTATTPGIRTVVFEVEDDTGKTNVVRAAVTVTVIAVPDVSLPPLVVVSPVAAGRTGSPIVVSPVLVVADVDSALLRSATVTVDGYRSGDVLGFDADLANGFSVDNTDGVLTFTADATPAQYQALLRSVTLTATDGGIRWVEFEITDPSDKSNLISARTAVTVVGITGTSIPPVVVASPVAAGLVGSSVAVSPVLLIADVDSTQLRGARVILSGFVEGDLLEVTADLSTDVGVDYSDGILTLTGPATVAEYQEVLRSLTLTSAQAGTKLVTFEVTDIGGAPSALTTGTAVTIIGLPSAALAPLVVAAPAAVGVVGRAVTVSPIVVITDLDSTGLTSAEVWIENFTDGDVLAHNAVLPDDVEVTYSDGVLTFYGPATLVQYQAWLETVTLTSTADGAKTIGFAVTDSGGKRSVVPATTTTVVLATPAASLDPVVVAAPVAVGVVGRPAEVSRVVVISDLDSDRIESARVELENYAEGDVLSYTGSRPNGVSVDFDRGVLTISGLATVEEYAQMLSGVTLTSASAGLRTLTFTVTDEDLNTSKVPAGAVVTVIDAPEAARAPLVLVAPVSVGTVGSPIEISSVVAIADLDSDRILSATVRLLNGAAGDVLDFGGELPTGVGIDITAGEITFTGGASVADYERLLSEVTLTAQAEGLKTVTFSVTDLEGHPSTVAAITTVTVVGIPDVSIPPVVVATPVAAGTVGSPITVSRFVALADPSSVGLQSAIVTVEGDSAGVVLGYTATLPADMVVQNTGGVLTFSGAASVDEYRELLESVTLTSSTGGVKTVTFALVDSTGKPSVGAAVTLVTVVPAVSAPIAPVVVVAPVAAGVAGQPIRVSPILAIADVDFSLIDSARVELAEPRAGDTLDFTGVLPSEVTVEYVDGGLVFDGPATAEEYQELLSSVTLTSTDAGLRTVTFTVADVDGNQSRMAAATLVTVLGLPALAAPIVLSSLISVKYTAGAGAVAVDPGLVVLDPDMSEISGAVVRIHDADPGDVLNFGATPRDVQGVYEDGVLTFVGTASAAEYQELLRTVTFSSGSSALADIRMIEFTVTDVDQRASLPTSVAVAVVSLPVTATPVIVTSLANVDYTAGSSAVVVDSNLLLLDFDSDVIAGAVVRIVGGAANGESLGFTMPAGFDLDYTYGGGVLTFTEAASKEVYQELLRSVTFTAPEGALATIKTISFVVTDDQNNTSAPGLVAVTVVKAPVGVAPLVVTSGVNLGYTAGDDPLSVDDNLTLLDLNPLDIASATVRISIGYAAGKDFLTYDEVLAGELGVDGSYANGVLTFTNAASMDDYQRLLRTVQISSDSSAPAALKTVTFRVTDVNGAQSLPGSVAVAVLALSPNVPPLVATIPVGPIYTAGNTPVAVNPLLTVGDLDQDDLTGAVIKISAGFSENDVLTFTKPEGSNISGGFDPDTGTLTLSGPGTADQYQQALRSVQFASSGTLLASVKVVSFTVTDARGATSPPGLVTLTVVANTPPLITAVLPVSTYSLTLGSLLTLSPATTIVDESSYLQSATVTIGGVHNNDNLSFTPVGDVVGAYQDGVLTLTGWGTPAEYAQVLSSVRFSTSGVTSVGLRTVTFRVVDMQGLSSNASGLALTVIV